MRVAQDDAGTGTQLGAWPSLSAEDRFARVVEAAPTALLLTGRSGLIEMVNRRDMKFDWFDAAVLSHQLGQHLAKELKTFLPKKAA